jgi:hypothetical protein
LPLILFLQSFLAAAAPIKTFQIATQSSDRSNRADYSIGAASVNRHEASQLSFLFGMSGFYF